ncbi:peptidoglycan-binding protein [Ancylothrix sp. C2]|uniref:GH25 family lysozyme n=1 Tax=Ancylothrix sp. D3o TaxID=2953691 RepID=UPI0021BA8DF0|nr:GH25 family lysozyme [Ancylothrix sp. D3o]MCT7951899.1 peptidoglycan-binding protein [Ancylothrix sp. D3o]
MGAYGIDVSDFQENVNWRAVADDGISFAFAKATEGTTFVADSFARNWSGMKSVKILRGAYHFFRPQSDPEAQAKHFLKIVKFEPGDLPAVLDIESSGGVSGSAIAERMTVWLNIVEKATKRKPIIYTYPGFWERIGNIQKFTDYPLWIAHYTNDPEPWVTGGWDVWTMWQFTDSGRVKGVSGPVDINRFQTSREGKRNSKVKTVQKCLKDKGFYGGTIDGYFGNTTKKAIVDFQRRRGLEADGLVGVETWTALLDGSSSANIAPAPSPTPSPAPKPTPTPAPKLDNMTLLDACRYYQAYSFQNEALDALQEQIPLNIMERFSQLWRNSKTVSPIRLIDVCKFYQGNSTQQQALQWLQGQISPGVMQQFAREWRAQSISQSTGIRLLDVCRFYQSKSNQNLALVWLQGQIPSATLQEFAKKWRNSNLILPIQLLDVCKFYQAQPHQDAALQWLQSQVSAQILEEFARRWRSNSAG